MPLSQNVKLKAKKMFQNGKVEELGVDIFQVVSSSNPNECYTIDTNDPTHPCWGYRQNGDCSHLEAIRLYKEEHRK